MYKPYLTISKKAEEMYDGPIRSTNADDTQQRYLGS